MKADSAQAFALWRILLGHRACDQLALGFLQCLTGHVDGGGEPVGQGCTGQQGQRSMGCVEPLLAPGDICETNLVSPVVRLECNGLPRRGGRLGAEARPRENDGERGPRFARPRVESAGFACVLAGGQESPSVRCLVRPCRLKGEHLCVGQA